MASWHDIGEAPPYAAGADLRTKQFLLVKQSAQTYILATAATDKMMGVLQNKPNTGEVCLVWNSGKVPVMYGGNVAVGDRLTFTTGGKAIATTTTGNVVIGTATKAGADNEIGEVEMAPIFPIP